MIRRAIRSQESVVLGPFESIKDILPSRSISDRLVQAYIRTFQTVFGIIHVPSFRQDYQAFWDDQRSSNEAFGIILVLVISIGSTFSNPESRTSRHELRKWISVASRWLNSFDSKARLTVDGLRIQCLYLLACQSCSIKDGVTSLSSGNLLRSAMHIGLHMDAEKHPSGDTSSADVQSRRRLWATILELEIQFSMDCGNLPLIGSDDYDCALPLNLDDPSLNVAKTNRETTPPQPLEQYTQSSFQVMLAALIPIRLRVAKYVNGFSSGNDYGAIIALSQELSAEITRCYRLIEGYKISSAPPTTFQTKLFDLLVYRFALGLHHPFAIKAMFDPSYFYSRRVCMGTSLALLSPPGEDFHRLLLHGSGLFRDVTTQAALYMCGELINDLEALGPFPCNPVTAFARNEMRNATQKYLELSADRLDAGERSVKRFVLISCLLAQADAVQACANVELKINAALSKAVQTGHDKLTNHLRVIKDKQQRPGLRLTPISNGNRNNDRRDWGWIMADAG